LEQLSRQLSIILVLPSSKEGAVCVGHDVEEHTMERECLIFFLLFYLDKYNSWVQYQT